MKEITEHQWRMFPATDASEHMRIHYMNPNNLTSAGFVEQRECGAPLHKTVNYFVTYNGSLAGITEQPVNTLREGMDIIEWLVREREMDDEGRR